MPIEDLAALVRERRSIEGLSLRSAAAEAGISFNTLSRVERGHIPDTATLVRLIEWLGVEPEAVLGPRAFRPEPTVGVIARHLRSDPALPADAAAKIASLVGEMYAVYARPAVPTAVHLRAARTFLPEAGALLADLLAEMEKELSSRAA